VLPERGYHATKVDHVVTAAGLSHGGFYRHFENMDDLFHVLADRAAREMGELIESFPADVEPGALHAWLENWFRSYRRHGGVISVWHELNDADADLARYAGEVAAAVLDRLGRIVQARGFGDSTVDAAVLLALVEGVPHTVVALDYMAEDDAVDASLVVIRRAVFGLDGGPRRASSRERR
jgi:AcrR family transcriptional regulator